MNVFLIRHAEADTEMPAGLGDEGRTLTARARHAIGRHFENLKAQMGSVDVIFTSPLVRCVQTATIFSLATGFAESLKAHQHLLPDTPVQPLATWVRQLPKNTVLFGHNPNVSALAAHLLGTPTLPGPVTPGTVIGLSRDDSGLFRLLFFASPQDVT